MFSKLVFRAHQKKIYFNSIRTFTHCKELKNVIIVLMIMEQIQIIQIIQQIQIIQHFLFLSKIINQVLIIFLVVRIVPVVQTIKENSITYFCIYLLVQQEYLHDNIQAYTNNQVFFHLISLIP